MGVGVGFGVVFDLVGDVFVVGFGFVNLGLYIC